MAERQKSNALIAAGNRSHKDRPKPKVNDIEGQRANLFFTQMKYYDGINFWKSLTVRI